MSKSPKGKSKTTKQPRSAALLLTFTALDTTWRTFLPIIGGTVAGVVIDRQIDTRPIFTSILLIVGVVIATYLVIKQLRDVRGEKE
jgi:F0F1-type ATP synthase assembly protein I